MGVMMLIVPAGPLAEFGHVSKTGNAPDTMSENR
jgi:hypothetical protein